jgi:hypothetical protein
MVFKEYSGERLLNRDWLAVVLTTLGLAKEKNMGLILTLRLLESPHHSNYCEEN